MPNSVFTGTAAAGAIAIINSFGNLGGFVAPYALGMLHERNGGVRSGLMAVALAEIPACYLILRFVRGALPPRVTLQQPDRLPAADWHIAEFRQCPMPWRTQLLVATLGRHFNPSPLNP